VHLIDVSVDACCAIDRYYVTLIDVAQDLGDQDDFGPIEGESLLFSGARGEGGGGGRINRTNDTSSNCPWPFSVPYP